ncbi:hypothetical protein FB451DRAFT_1569150 [Mycena latifolia]|nr:hypothetical protein FB451DRAFT_1569150 [Mycena latifolia]
MSPFGPSLSSFQNSSAALTTPGRAGDLRLRLTVKAARYLLPAQPPCTRTAHARARPRLVRARGASRRPNQDNCLHLLSFDTFAPASTTWVLLHPSLPRSAPSLLPLLSFMFATPSLHFRDPILPVATSFALAPPSVPGARLALKAPPSAQPLARCGFWFYITLFCISHLYPAPRAAVRAAGLLHPPAPPAARPAAARPGSLHTLAVGHRQFYSAYPASTPPLGPAVSAVALLHPARASGRPPCRSAPRGSVAHHGGVFHCPLLPHPPFRRPPALLLAPQRPPIPARLQAAAPLRRTPGVLSALRRHRSSLAPLFAAPWRRRLRCSAAAAPTTSGGPAHAQVSWRAAQARCRLWLLRVCTFLPGPASYSTVSPPNLHSVYHY